MRDNNKFVGGVIFPFHGAGHIADSTNFICVYFAGLLRRQLARHTASRDGKTHTNKVNNTSKASFKCSNLGVTNNKNHAPPFDR